MDKDEFLRWYLTFRTPEKPEQKPKQKPERRTGLTPVLRKKKKTVAKKRKQKTKKKPRLVDYYVYINSNKWVKKSRKWRKDAGKCEVCGSVKTLQCHHLHYRTLGRENRRDIQVLCAKCHKKAHDI